MSIQLNKSVNNLYFYDKLLSEVANFYHNWDNNSTPSFNFNKTTYIDPPFLPLFASLGLYLKKYHIGKNIKENSIIELNNTPDTIKTIHFLDKSEFFDIVGKQLDYKPVDFSLDIFDFDKKIIGGYSGYIFKEQRNEHKLNVYFPSQDKLLNYNQLTIEQKSEYRDKLLEKFIVGKVQDDFAQVLYNDEINRVITSEIVLTGISELIENGIIHSGSEVFSSIFSSNKRSIISVADIGIGFEASLGNKSESEFPLTKFYILNHFKKEKKYIKNFHNCYIIFDALLFSLNRNRHGLIDVILEYPTQENGYSRIHDTDLQIVISNRYFNIIDEIKQLRKKIIKAFTNNMPSVELQSLFLKGAELLIELCERIIDNYNIEINVSSIRKFKTRFPGVHIECELKN
ncbi:MAG: hypothetical protein JW870_20840 [Candidatus Delongbacteria bacterium]|nr:hypothetical protein [Candidatus Delongbacteria bacterium]